MKTSYSVIAFSLLSITSAGYCAESQPTTPPPPVLQHCNQKTYCCDAVTVELFGKWLYLQPNGSTSYYAVEAFPYNMSIGTPEVSPSWQVFEIDPSYHSGFEVGMQFLFPKNDMSLEVNWERLHTQDRESMTVTPLNFGTGNMVGPFMDIGPNSEAYKKAKGHTVYNFDEAKLILGKTLCFVNDLKTRFYTGAGFARIKESISSVYSSATGQTARRISSDSTFIGAGPEFGVNFNYRLVGGFNFTGDISAALFMGQLKNHTTYESYSPFLAGFGSPNPNPQHVDVPNRTQVIPGFDEKLGFSYVASFNGCQITIGAGYQFQIYLNAIQSVDMTAPQVLPSLVPGADVEVGVYAVGLKRTLSNFMLTGPYASLAIDF